jgi:hypothetical protein
VNATFLKYQSHTPCHGLLILLIFELAFIHGSPMKKFTALLSVALMTLSAPSFSATCEAQAADKKLAGAAKNSFVQKCEKDAAAALATATATCEAQAADKKLAGAAKNSFTKKCIKDATGG